MGAPISMVLASSSFVRFRAYWANANTDAAVMRKQALMGSSVGIA
jgi:hypothetical protein